MGFKLILILLANRIHFISDQSERRSNLKFKKSNTNVASEIASIQATGTACQVSRFNTVINFKLSEIKTNSENFNNDRMI